MNTQNRLITRGAARLSALSALSALAAVALLAACGGGHDDETAAKKVVADTSATIRVVTAIVQASPFEDWGQYSADLRGVDDVVLTAPAPGGGRVNAVTEVGRRVTKGESLCDIDAELYQAQLKQAQAAVALAEGEASRARENVKEGFLGEAATDKAELDLQAARTTLFQARRAHADSRCEAPFAGTLVSRFVEKHQTAAPGAPTVRVAALGRLEALVSIPESEAFAYGEGQRAEFLLLQDGAKPVPGRIETLDRAVQEKNRVVAARVRLDNPGSLRPGMIGRVRILRERYEKALVVPSQAVLRLQEGTAVMKVENGRARKVPVTLGPSRGDSVMITSGVSAGDRIITVGAFQVSDGTKVAY